LKLHLNKEEFGFLLRGANVPDTNEVFQKSIDSHLEAVRGIHAIVPVLERVADEMTQAILQGKKVFWCGNGGSAADSQHLAAEFVGRFLLERRALPSIALHANTSVLTAIANDYGYEYVYKRQIEALCAPGDIVVGISTSGKSKNVCYALESARKLGAFTVAFTGREGNAMGAIAHETVCIPSSETPRIQEGHILCGHMLCDYVERAVYELEKLTAAEPAKV
jgi:D-sedoheptulose 7-phosphate isomerase